MSVWAERGFATRDVHRIRDGILRWLKQERPAASALIERGDLGLRVYPDGDEGSVAWSLHPDDEAPRDVRDAWAYCTTCYRHPDGLLEVYL